MTRFRLFITRIRAIVQRRRRDADLADELRFHLDTDADERAADGLPPGRARLEARRELGRVAGISEDVRAVWTWGAIERVLQDVRHGARTLRRTPAFTLAAILSLALGIGATTAVFTLLDQVVLRLLPVANPREIVQTIPVASTFNGGSWGDRSELSYPMYADLRDHNQVFTGMFGRAGTPVHIGHADRTERVTAEAVTGTYFSVLGVTAAVGRAIVPDDDGPGRPPVAMVSFAYWKTRFAADPSIVGQTILVNDRPVTLIGVAQPGFDGLDVGEPVQVFVPIRMQPTVLPAWLNPDDRRFRWVRTFGRLKPGITATQAAASLQPFFRERIEMEANARAFDGASPYVKQQFLQARLDVEPAARGRSSLRRLATRPLWILVGVAGGVLLIACANVASLLLSRHTVKQREIAMKLALGASRRRVVQQLLIESMLLALIGGVLGALVAMWGAGVVIRIFASGATLPIAATPDLRVLLFLSAIIGLATLLFGVVPALQSTRPALAPTLKNETGAVAGGGHGGLRSALVVVQVAVSAILLVGATTFARSLANLFAVDLGMNVEHVLAFTIDPVKNGYTPARTQQLQRAIVDTLPTVPGVTSAAYATIRVLGGGNWNGTLTIQGYAPAEGENVDVSLNTVSVDYFRTLGMPFVAGRDFTTTDIRQPPPTDGSQYRVAIVNETLVRTYIRGNPHDAIGRRIGIGGTIDRQHIAIVGVVRDAAYSSVRGETRPQAFFPLVEGARPPALTVFVRTAGDPARLAGTIRETMRALDPRLPLTNVRTLSEQWGDMLRTERIVAGLSTAFGALATLLAAIGLYGVLSYAVTRRTREIGIRLALGARTTTIASRIVRDAVLLVTFGLIAGLPVAWWLGRSIETLLYGISPMDPVTLGSIVVGLFLVATIAAGLPARRAARLDPLTALRYD